jgi:hypothetical protein
MSQDNQMTIYDFYRSCYYNNISAVHAELTRKATELIEKHIHCRVPEQMLTEQILNDFYQENTLTEGYQIFGYYLISNYLGSLLKDIADNVYQLNDEISIWCREGIGDYKQEIIYDKTIQLAILKNDLYRDLKIVKS